jgi:endonuclease/exonuclease/phosphatase family metal-dependent hydrolase
MVAAGEWTVVTWNVHGSAGPDVRALAAVLAAQAPDVIALQEIRWHQAFLVSRRLRMRRSWALKHFPLTPLLPWLAEGMAILTPHQLAEPRVRIISRGASVWTFRRRITQWATVVRGRPADHDELVVFNAHLSPGDLAAERRDEARRLAELCRRVASTAPLVIAGDLNDADDPTIVATLPAIEADAPPPTNPADGPYQTIDHVLVPPDATGVSTSVPAGGSRWARFSDHLPVTVRFSRPASEG